MKLVCQILGQQLRSFHKFVGDYDGYRLTSQNADENEGLCSTCLQG